MSSSDARNESRTIGLYVRNQRDLAKIAQGRAINAALHSLGWNQSDLARAAGVPRYTISRAIRGENVLGAEVLSKVARALQVDPAELLGSDRSTLDDMPMGVHSTPLSTGEVWLRVNGTVHPGVHLAIEALFNHDSPLSNNQLKRIIDVITQADEDHGGNKVPLTTTLQHVSSRS